MILFDYFMNGPFKARELVGQDRHFSETNYRICLQIGKVAELLAFVAVYDPHTMIELNKWFDQIVSLATEENQLQVAAIAKSAAYISEDLILSHAFTHIPMGLNRQDKQTNQAQKVQRLKNEIEVFRSNPRTRIRDVDPDARDRISIGIEHIHFRCHVYPTLFRHGLQ